MSPGKFSYPGKKGLRIQVVVMQMYGTLGAFAAILASAYFTLKKLDIKIEQSDMLAIIVAASGMFLFFISRVFVQYYEHRDFYVNEVQKKEYLAHAILRSWDEFEKESAAVVDMDSDGRPVPLRYILRNLKTRLVIDENLLNRLETALQIRNKVAHGMADEVSQGDMVQSLDDIAEARSALVQFTE